MLMNVALELYEKLRLMHYRALFDRIREKDGSLSATEAYSVDVIHILKNPTIKQFSDFLGISQPNATYKITSLVDKGYIEKIPSETDKREFHLKLADKFYSYFDENNAFMRTAVDKLEANYKKEELALFERMLRELNEAL